MESQKAGMFNRNGQEDCSFFHFSPKKKAFIMQKNHDSVTIKVG